MVAVALCTLALAWLERHQAPTAATTSLAAPPGKTVGGKPAK